VTVLGFTVTFHSAFRVGSAYARDGIDVALDEHDPLPADHLKGVMRASAAGLLGAHHPALTAVFGSPRAPSPWSWSSAEGTWDFETRHRVKISHDTHSAVKDHLVLGQQARPAGTGAARCTVTRSGSTISPIADHVLVLRCAAAGVHGLGAWRRRGLGWVGIQSEDGPVTPGDITRLLALKVQTR
jgi:hypothetical protein